MGLGAEIVKIPRMELDSSIFGDTVGAVTLAQGFKTFMPYDSGCALSETLPDDALVFSVVVVMPQGIPRCPTWLGRST